MIANRVELLAERSMKVSEYLNKMAVRRGTTVNRDQLSQYVEDLAPYSVSVIEEACERLGKDATERRSWPMLGTLLDACKEVGNERWAEANKRLERDGVDCPSCDGEGWFKEPPPAGKKLHRFRRCEQCHTIGKVLPETL